MMSINNQKLKICLAASAGGHLTQLLKLSGCWNDNEVFCVSTLKSAVKKIQKFGRYYIIGECNREHPWQVLKVLKNCLGIILKEKPDVIISTGAGPACLLCIVGKLLRAKIIWIDRIANVERLSLSGRIIRPFANLILTQWPEVAKQYKSVYYAGNLL